MNSPAFVIIIPLISAIIIPLVGRISHFFSWYITVISTFASFVFSIILLNTVTKSGRISYWLGGWEPPYGIEYAVDYLNGFVLVVISFIAFIVAIYAKRSVQKDIEESKTPFFYSVYMFFFTGLMGIIITGDIFNLYVFIEISAIAGYALVAMGKQKEALVASYNYLILGTVAAAFILLGIGYLYMVTGTLNMADLSVRLPELYDSTVVRAAFAFILVGISIKLALFPLHVWLPGVYSNAPPVVSALMAATTSKVFAYVLLRVMFTIFKIEFSFEVVPVAKILLFISSIAIIAGSILAIAQTNIKRMLAYSSIGQIGYIILGIALANQASITGSMMHILNHALIKGTLFLVVGVIVYRTGIEEISGLKGMGKKMPFTMAAFTIGALSIIGVPLTVGFVSKWYLALGALSADMWYLIPVILLSSLLTAIYFWRVVEGIYFHEPEADNSVENLSTGSYYSKYLDATPASMAVPIFILSGLCIIFGIVAFVPVNLASSAADMLLGVH